VVEFLILMTESGKEDDVDNDCFENAYVTGLEAGTQTGSRDVDDFNTILTSPILDLSGNQDYILNYDVWFSNGFSWGAPPNDSLTVSVSNGATNVVIDILTASSNNLGEWSSKSFDLSQIISLNNNIQFSIETADWDALGGHWVEGGFDNFYISNSLPSNIIENINDNKKLIKVIDILGRESNFNSQLPLIYIYDDGSIEKRIIIK